ncbi:hypothetical protein EC178850_4828, partial [Escherichia coli 178850]
MSVDGELRQNISMPAARCWPSKSFISASRGILAIPTFVLPNGTN